MAQIEDKRASNPELLPSKPEIKIQQPLSEPVAPELMERFISNPITQIIPSAVDLFTLFTTQPRPVTWYFCTNPELPDSLLDLILVALNNDRHTLLFSRGHNCSAVGLPLCFGWGFGIANTPFGLNAISLFHQNETDVIQTFIMEMLPFSDMEKLKQRIKELWAEIYARNGY